DNSYALLKKWGERQQDELTTFVPGTIYKLDIDNTHPLAYGYPNYYYTLKEDKNVYSFLKDGWNVGVLKKNNYVAGFVGSKAKPQIKDGVVFGVQDVGRGHLIFMADDPLFRAFWEGGKLLFTNAVFMMGE
ncbi:MAG: zinc carboxypeptidase, partial [Bacteroidota bacterium]|nr:zinc carboxypeptidase [Bacteroidota bacterium]